MYCFKCGFQVSDEALFCPKCGQKQQPLAQLPTTTTPVVASASRSSIPDPEPQWEICEVTFDGQDRFGRGTRSIFQAVATGPGGRYTVTY